MVAVLLPNGKQQFIDINGRPLVGGTVGMYVPNTLVPKTTWQNAGQTVLNTDPIVLDSRGQALIYGSGIYRQIVRDALGNLIWDELVSAPGTNTRAFVPPTDVPLTDVEYPVLPVITPEMFGAVGDGITDDTAAIQDALDFMASTRPGPLTFGLNDYMVRSGPIIIPRCCGLKGQCDLFGVFASEANTGIATRILNDSDNDTVQFSNLDVYVEGIIFAAPQPVFQPSISNTGTITAVGDRYSGFNLTPGTYAFVFSGGFGTGAAGTATIGPNGKYLSSTMSNVGSGYLGPGDGAGGLACPLVTATITGGNQRGAHIMIKGGADPWRIENCAFLSKDFNICCNNNHVIKTVNGSYAAAGNQQIPIANTSGLTELMVINNVSNPQSLRQNNLIASGGVVTNSHITMSYAVDEASAGSADTIIAGIPVYFIKGQIKGCSFWGSTYWQVYGNWGAENVDIHDCFFVTPGGGMIFCGTGLDVTIERNNLDGVFAPKAFALQCISPPASVKNNAIGNITGETGTLVATGIYVSGRLVFGGSVAPSYMTLEGNRIYAPLPRGIWLESVTGANLLTNRINTYVVANISGCLGLKMDALSEGNTIVYGADAGPNDVTTWAIASQRNWIRGPWGDQKPYRKVSVDTTMDGYDYTVACDAVRTIKLPFSAAWDVTQSGLEFSVINVAGGTGTVTIDGNGANINGGTTFALPNNFDSATFRRAANAQWFVVSVKM